MQWSIVDAFCRVLALFSIIGSLALGVRLLHSTVALKHPPILLYLLAQVGGNWAWFSHPHEMRPMQWAEAVTVVAAVAVLYDLCRESLADYPAIRRFASQSMLSTLGVCVVVALAIMWLNPLSRITRSPALQEFDSQVQAVDGGLFAFIVFFGGLLVWFPLKIRRNTLYIIIGFAIYFAVHCLALFVQNSMPDGVAVWCNLFESSLGAILLICGLVLLNAEGENVPVTTGHRWDPGAMKGLTNQLEAINAKLANVQRERPAVEK
ncbi:MAG: hypothetical protein ABI824_09840 [Acidobacteriota bacterium]